MDTKLVGKFLMVVPAIMGMSWINSSGAIAAETYLENQAAANAVASAVPTASTAQIESNYAASVPSVSALDSNALAQVTSVSQLADVQPTDWAFQALQSLVERYGCIAGYPDGTYRGNRALTRFEFAAGLNACLDRVNELIAAGLADAVTREDLASLQRLQEEFAAELATLRGQVDALEARTAELEANQFSTTTTLVGEAVFAISDVFGGESTSAGNVGEENNTVFQSRVRLNFDTSFTGTDRLRARLQAGNFDRFVEPGAGEARLAFDTNTSSEVRIDDLFYQFNLGDRTRIGLFANAADLRDIVFENVASPFVSSGRGAISRFGRFSPIYRVANTSAGASINYQLTDPDATGSRFSVQLGYGSGENANPDEGTGLFNGDYGLIAQLAGRNLLGGDLDLILTYVNSYTGTAIASDGSITAGVRSPSLGSRLARVDADRPVAVNSYGLEANYRLSPVFQIGGWVGFSSVRALGLGDGDVLNYAVTLAFPDLGGRGNLGGLVLGMQPRLIDADSALATVLGTDSDPDTGFHIEGFYRLALSNNIEITPGIIWLTAPDHDEDNDDILVGVVRTTFRF